MLIKILRNTVADGKPVKEGDVLDVSDNNARTLLLMGKAQKHEGEAPARTVIVPAALPIPPAIPATTATENKDEANGGPASGEDNANAGAGDQDPANADAAGTGEGAADLGEDDPDLGLNDPDLGENPLPTDYQELCTLAESLGIQQPAKIKKVTLIELIKEKQAQAAA